MSWPLCTINEGDPYVAVLCVCVPIANCPTTGVFQAISSCLWQFFVSLFFVSIVQASLDAGQAYAHCSSGCQTL